MQETRLVIHTDSQYVNIRCDRIFQDTNFLYAYDGEELVGMFSIGTFDAAWLSEKRGNRNDRMQEEI